MEKIIGETTVQNILFVVLAIILLIWAGIYISRAFGG